MNMYSKLLAVVAVPMAVFLTGCKSKHDPSEEREAYLALNNAVSRAGSEHNCREAMDAWNATMGNEKRSTSRDARMSSTRNLRALPLKSLNRNELRNLACADLKLCYVRFGHDKVKFAPGPFGSMQIFVGGLGPVNKSLLHADNQRQVQYFEVEGEEEEAGRVS